MNKDVAEKWVTALRSGKYEQGRYQLKDNDGKFDAVGVLCDLAPSGMMEVRQFTKPSQFEGYTFDGEPVRCPAAVSDWADLGYWTANHILAMNDKGKSFAEIADWIEENL